MTMVSNKRTLLIAAMLALPLPLLGCASVGPDTFDPTEWFSGDLFNSKKPLPGDRKAGFPEGVPGVAKGVPPELMRGPVPGAEGDLAPPVAAAVPDEPRAKAKPKPKPKPKVATTPAPPPATRVTVPRRETEWPD